MNKFNFFIFWLKATSKPPPAEYNKGHHSSCLVLENKNKLKFDAKRCEIRSKLIKLAPG